ncbi:hypothetical protein CENSYa_0757 [Cenarchaeum symbiosum A]|uniref:Uncharacterized protein n=1 Tax=Cenarchaeum symbiosum (strain A) TaxID=414004 RepID=A0RVM3_CENSY|nr:hypothetical protein CENSYa_0757 [Cenarchaeum symbiosum A]
MHVLSCTQRRIYQRSVCILPCMQSRSRAACIFYHARGAACISSTCRLCRACSTLPVHRGGTVLTAHSTDTGRRHRAAIIQAKNIRSSTLQCTRPWNSSMEHLRQGAKRQDAAASGAARAACPAKGRGPTSNRYAGGPCA